LQHLNDESEEADVEDRHFEVEIAEMPDAVLQTERARRAVLPFLARALKHTHTNVRFQCRMRDSGVQIERNAG
jgi:hypothetical protein